MRVPGFRRLKGYGKWCVNTLTRPGVVLLYHRVIDLDCDPQQLAVSRANFEQQMRIVRNRMMPLPLEQVINCARGASLPKNAVAVTFDDGYFDNLEFAAPVLEKYNIPATIYVASGQVGRATEFWWDELDAILLGDSCLPDRCSLIVAGKVMSWRLGPSSEQPELQRGWNVDCWNNSSLRQNMYRDLCGLLRPFNARDRGGVLNQLREWAGTDGTARPTHRAVTERELNELGRNPLIEIGCHTHRHSLLSALPSGDQKQEIEGGKARLEDILGKPVQSFAYPFGGREDYSAETVKLVTEAGFRSACANWFGWINEIQDVFQVPRFLVRNWTGSELEKRLAQCRFV